MLNDFFSCFARWIERQSGRSGTFALAFGVVLVWALAGPFFHYSETWQLVINTGTTIVTFLMVFLIQNAQNCDTQALQLKFDELIRVTEAARNNLINLEERSEQDLSEVKSGFDQLAARAGSEFEAVIEEQVEREVDEELAERGLRKP
jgi:low affinity Fe/Cu permease